jgi:hypothetical protein
MIETVPVAIRQTGWPVQRWRIRWRGCMRRHRQVKRDNDAEQV